MKSGSPSSNLGSHSVENHQDGTITRSVWLCTDPSFFRWKESRPCCLWARALVFVPVAVRSGDQPQQPACGHRWVLTCGLDTGCHRTPCSGKTPLLVWVYTESSICCHAQCSCKDVATLWELSKLGECKCCSVLSARSLGRCKNQYFSLNK